MRKSFRFKSYGVDRPQGLPRRSFTGALIFSLVLMGCASSGNAPIEDRSAPPLRKITVHVVEPSDTLYSIAWRYEKDYKQIARLNGLAPPYTIHKGQRLKLDASDSSDSRSRQSELANRAASTSAVRTTAIANTRVSTADSSRTTSSSTQIVTPPVVVVPASVDGWQWPLQGKIIKSFGSNSLTKGITLDTVEQKDVIATADGVVVYAGSGIRGYGNFLILKHSDLFLSAYAYNAELIAQEGDQVLQGQLIAKSGKDQDGLPRLYFEIRKDGTPVDPVRYLPRR